MSVARKILTAFRLYREEGIHAVLNRFRELCYKKKLLLRKRIVTIKKRSPIQVYLEDKFRVASQNEKEQTTYVPKALDTLEGKVLPLKMIAFYSQQYNTITRYSVDECINWIDVSKAQAQYLGHYQPHYPGELGYYDLRVPEIMQEQIKLAKQYGIQGFCFYYSINTYQDSMNLSVQQLLSDETLVIDFCICIDCKDLICTSDLENNYSSILLKVLPILKDQRYITFSGMPIVVMKNVDLLADAKTVINQWRQEVTEHDLLGLYLIAISNSETQSPVTYGCDALLECPLSISSILDVTSSQKIVNEHFIGKIYDYGNLVEIFSTAHTSEFLCYKTVIPSWDNEAQKPSCGTSYLGATPELYAKWLAKASEITLQRSEKESHLVFINAWNDWNRGAHLEPDRKYGYGYLHATANVLRNLCQEDRSQLQSMLNTDFRKQSDIAIIVHVYYEDVGLEIIESILQLQTEAQDIIITVREDCSDVFIQSVHMMVSNVYFIFVKNHGRDILPFMTAYQFAVEQKYQYICKLHTKKSLHRKDGDFWRKTMVENLLANGKQAVQLFTENHKLGLLAPSGMLMNVSDDFLSNNFENKIVDMENRYWLDELLHRLDCRKFIGSYDIYFPAGSMYWVKTDALAGLFEKIDEIDFELEAGQINGTLAHAIERSIGVVVEYNGYQQKEIGKI